MGNMARLALLSVNAIILVGCANIAPLNWSSPGTARHQQLVAEQYDPYPENDVGTPLVGGRPRGYMYPAAETLRARWPLGNNPG